MNSSICSCCATTKQAEGDDQLFAGSAAKKRKVVVDEGDEDSFVSVEVGGKTLNIKKAARANEDICVPLEPGQLQILFEFLDQPGTSALVDPPQGLTKRQVTLL